MVRSQIGLWDRHRVDARATFYEVDPGLAGRRVELVFDPFELAEIEVRVDGRHAGLAVPLNIKRHVHPRAQPPAEPSPPTGIDYLGLIRRRREQDLQKRIDYRNLPGAPQPSGGAGGRPGRQQGADGMSIDRLRGAHWGLSRTPFTKQLAPSMLFGSTAHQEAVARIGWIITERALGVVCGEGSGAGKTVAARAASAGLDQSRHTIIYLPNPAIGARGIYTQIVSALGSTPRFYRATLIPQATDCSPPRAASAARPSY